ncbi:MAG: GNAT family N-acetyltransferase [Anaerolineae bacterium]|nr:GNAT family N-acetyltransferase [Anaerolineae bacterium]
MLMEIMIRAVAPGDVEDLAEVLSMPKCQRQTLQTPYKSIEEVKRRYTNIPDNKHVLVAVVKETQKVVGSISLVRQTAARRSHVAVLGMAVHDDYHGQGIGSQLMTAIINLAENWLNVTRLELTVYVDNQPALELYRKFGFIIEGTLSNYAFRDGVFIDAHFMARVKS